MSDQEDDFQVEVLQEKVDPGMLIEVIQQYEFIFNIAHPNYKQAKTKERAWAEIAKTLNCSVKAAQKTWKSLRDRFTKEKNKERSGAEAPQSVWPYFNLMLFYGKYSKPRRTYTSTTSSTTNTSFIEASDRPSSSHSVWSSDEIIFSPPPQPTEETEGAVQETSTEHFTGSHSKKKRKRDTSISNEKNQREVLHLVENISTYLENDLKTKEPKANNVNRSFADYVATRLEEMDNEEAKIKRQPIFAVLEA